jgi:hypothetical protein
MRAVLSLAATAALAALGVPGEARAYCLTSACGDQTAGTVCVPGTELDCGEPLRWKTRCTGFAIQEDGSRRVGANRLNDLARAAFASWTDTECDGGERPGLVVQPLGAIPCGELEYNSNAGNANIIVFREDGWPHPASAHNVALTTTTFDPETGELFDADIELNSSDFEFTTEDDDVVYDLESVLTHEAGHFLGVGHTDVEESTMLPIYIQGDTALRTLGPDDANAICDLYPPKDIDETCNPLPRHGFSPSCEADQTEGNCAVASSGVGARRERSPLLAVAAMAALAAGAAIRRRRECPWAPPARTEGRPRR